MESWEKALAVKKQRERERKREREKKKIGGGGGFVRIGINKLNTRLCDRVSHHELNR